MSVAKNILESMGDTGAEEIKKGTDLTECMDKNGKGLSKGSKVKTSDSEGEVSRIYSEDDKEYVVVNDKSYASADVEAVED